jgi:prepilin-type N-terminal cleavage/methylation domain-containing protein
MKAESGFTLTELMVVVAIVAILSAVAIPMYTDNVRKTRVQEAVDTIGAIKDEITSSFSEDGILPNRCNNHRQIRDVVGVQVPERGKWRYRIRDNGVIYVRAHVPLGRSLSGGWIRCTPQVDWNTKAITHRLWRCDGRRIKSSYLPR